MARAATANAKGTMDALQLMLAHLAGLRERLDATSYQHHLDSFTRWLGIRQRNLESPACSPTQEI